MPIHTYAGWKRMTTLCKTLVPKQIEEDLEAIKVHFFLLKNKIKNKNKF